MTKRKAKTRSPQHDPASAYRSKLEARKAAAQAREAATWSPSLNDRFEILFATLLHSATAPRTRFSGIRKGLLERYVFPAATRHTADRKALFRSSQSVMSSAHAKNSLSFRQAKSELQSLWLEVKKCPTSS